MEYMEGETLADRLSEGRSAPGPGLKIGSDMRRGAGEGAPARYRASRPEARQHHADEGGAKLMDFGLAKPTNAAFATAATPLAESTPTMSDDKPGGARRTLNRPGRRCHGDLSIHAPEVLQGTGVRRA